jgi:hypothetical protein
MFRWFRERKEFEKITRITNRVFNQALIEIRKDIRDIQERLDEIEKVQRTLCDDVMDLQADLTLIHNIEGYEEWREEIGKPVRATTVNDHTIDCGWQQDQYEWECTCKPVSKPTDIVK